jgi:hypothetical protein
MYGYLNVSNYHKGYLELSIKDIDLPHDNSNIWVISEGRYSDVNLKGEIEGNVAGPYKEYMISDIGRYLLNPDSIEVKKKTDRR